MDDELDQRLSYAVANDDRADVKRFKTLSSALPPGIEVVKHSDGMHWCVRNEDGPSYWNGSWSLQTFGDRFATKYVSEQAAIECFLVDNVLRAILNS